MCCLGYNLVPFDLANPSVVDGFFIGISGVTAGETLVGIDFRPLNGLLYGLGENSATDTATLYVISTRTGVAAAVGTLGRLVTCRPGITALISIRWSTGSGSPPTPD